MGKVEDCLGEPARQISIVSASMESCEQAVEEKRLPAIDTVDLVENRKLELEVQVADAAELGVGDGLDPTSDDRESCVPHDDTEVAEVVVHEACFLSNLAVDLQEAWFVGSGELGDVAGGNGRYHEPVDFVVQFGGKGEETRVGVEIGEGSASDVVRRHRSCWEDGLG